MLPLLFTKEQLCANCSCRSLTLIAPVALKKRRLSKEQWEKFALGHKNGKTSKKMSKHIINTIFLYQIACFLRTIRSNPERITDVDLLKIN